MIYELRIYHMNPGKMEAIHRRFGERMFTLLDRHGIRVIDFYNDAEGRETIYYICEFESREAQSAAWKALFADPEFMEVARKYDEDGPIMKSHESYTMERDDFFRR